MAPGKAELAHADHGLAVDVRSSQLKKRHFGSDQVLIFELILLLVEAEPSCLALDLHPMRKVKVGIGSQPHKVIGGGIHKVRTLAQPCDVGGKGAAHTADADCERANGG